MKRRKLILLGAVGALAINANVRADQPTTAPVEDYRAQVAAAGARINQSMKAFMTLVNNAQTLHDPAKASQVRSQASALFRQADAAATEWAQARQHLPGPTTGTRQPTDFAYQIHTTVNSRLLPFMIALRDPETLETVSSAIHSDEPARVQVGKLESIEAQLLLSPDVQARTQLVQQYLDLARVGPTDTNHSLSWILNLPTDTPAEEQQRRSMVMAAFPDAPVTKRLKLLAVAANTVKSLEGKPLAIEGTTVQGEPFSTAQWKGRVVLVDFWATWCGPCKAALPHAKATYQKYHEQGLEMVGVSNDYTRQALERFLAADPQMSWTELFDPAAAERGEWHPLSMRLGVNGIPRCFLIDRNGICRTVEARVNMDDMIPKLLTEPGPAALATPATDALGTTHWPGR